MKYSKINMSKSCQLLISTILLALMSSCTNADRAGERRVSTPSSGQPFELMVVMDDPDRQPTLKSAVQDVFAVDYPGLPQQEAWFDLRFIAKKNVSNLHRRQSNIIFIGSQENSPEVYELIKSIFGEERVNEITEHPESFYTSGRDIWARPQLVLALFDGEEEELIEKMKMHAKFLRDQITAVEERRLRSTVYRSGEQRRLQERLKDELGFSLRLPSYLEKRVEVKSPDERLESIGLDGFIWFRGETRKTGNNILLYYKQYEDESEFDISHILAFRDSVGKHFIPGPSEGSYMATEITYHIPEAEEIDLNGHYAVRTYGLWRVENDIMGGPFVNFTVYDREQKRLIMMDAFLYAPEVRKRDFMKRLEVVLKSLQIDAKAEAYEESPASN